MYKNIDPKVYEQVKLDSNVILRNSRVVASNDVNILDKSMYSNYYKEL